MDGTNKSVSRINESSLLYRTVEFRNGYIWFLQKSLRNTIGSSSQTSHFTAEHVFVSSKNK